MATSHVPLSDGNDLLLWEIRTEAERLAAHPVAEVKRLERVAAEGESAVTPLLVVLAVALFAGAMIAVVTAVTMAVYYGS